MTAMNAASEKEFVERCDAIFNSMNRKYLGKIANFLNWSIEDMRQEFRLVCWEAWLGRNNFDSSVGDIKGYFFGKTRTFLYKRDGYRNFKYVDDMIAGKDFQGADTAKSVLEELIDREEQEENDKVNCQRHMAYSSAGMPVKGRRSLLYRLWKQGMSQTQIAKIGGCSQGQISRVLKKEAASYANAH
ncbi:MAG: hypothetical protein LBI48_09405 [Burkholderiaceae bacterium]|nr:hypothetical protein [Burkholderiaceae bacterium]